jgi:hypothetical protein
MKFLTHLLIAIVSGSLLPSTASAEPGAAFANVKDYGSMGWLDGLQDPNFRIQTSRYVLNYHHPSFGPTALAPLTDSPPEGRLTGAEIALDSPVALACKVMGNGGSYPAVAASADLRTSQLVESGKFFNRRWQTGAVVGGPACDAANTGLETAAWPDRVSFVFRFAPTVEVKDGLLEMTLDLPDIYRRLSSHGEARTLANERGAGFVVLGSSGTASLVIDEAKAFVTVKSRVEAWKPGQMVSVGIIVYPVANGLKLALSSAAANELQPLPVSAKAVVPAVGELKVSYEKDQGYHRIIIPKGSEGDNGQMRARVSVRNPNDFPRIVRLNFDGHPFYIPGISAVIRDSEGFPMGIPVQLSKNWHGPDPCPPGPAGFAGVWFHGLTMLTVAPSSTFEFELMMVGENWGGMPAASHSQLSIIGYGGNQQWDQAALGNKAEALCYDMDHVLTDNDFTDSRPFWVLNPDKQRNWGVNAGGGSVLRYIDDQGITRRHSRMRVRYERHGPVLANAVFTGRSDDGRIDFSFSAGLYRSEDYTRGLHRIRISANQDAPFKRLVFYQQAGDSYHYNQGDTLAWGNAEKSEPIRQWTASVPPGEVTAQPFELSGKSPWVSITNAPTEKGYLAANHGFIIRSWSARIGGRDGVPPFLQERSIAPGVSILELVPPAGVKALKAGDFFEFDMVRVYIPRSAEAYAGPDENFRQALIRHDNSPLMIAREAIANRPQVRATLGEIVRELPLEIRVRDNRAGFVVRGGVGVFPVTFSGLGTYRYPLLEEKTADGWKPVDQSVHGKDFWQCDFRPETGRWDITFTVRRDGLYQDLPSHLSSPVVREFRFSIAKKPGSLTND